MTRTSGGGLDHDRSIEEIADFLCRTPSEVRQRIREIAEAEAIGDASLPCVTGRPTATALRSRLTGMPALLEQLITVAGVSND